MQGLSKLMASSIRMPLCDSTAEALADVLLASDADCARGLLLALLRADPVLLAWAVAARSQATGSPLVENAIPSSDELGEWLAPQLLKLLSDASASMATLDNDEVREACGDLAAEATARRVVAARLAADASLEAREAGRAEMFAVLSTVETWPSTAPTESDSAESSVAKTVTAESHLAVSPAVDVAVRAIRCLADRRRWPLRGLSRAEVRRQAAEARQRWLVRLPARRQRLAALVDRLARLERLETQFAETLEQEKLASLAEFAAAAGHEINNPVAVISGRSQLFLRSERDPDRRRELATIHAQAMRIHEMIADLMLFARPPQPALDDCDVVEIVERVAAETHERAAERGLVLATVVPPAPLVIRADATQLAVALRAIVDNSIRAGTGPGRIEIVVREAAASTNGHGAAVEVIVRDTGHGIAPDVRRHLFDPYFSGRLAGRGLGLGLSKAWRIVTAHGGAIEIDGTSEQGTSLTIRLHTRPAIATT